MNILEIPVIGSWKSQKESIFTLLSDRPLRKFEGLDIGHLPVNKDVTIYFYFINQESEDYKYLWDLILPHAIGCVVVCDLENSEVFEKNVEVIEYLKDRYSCNLYICSLPVQGQEPAVLKSSGLIPEDIAEFMYLDPNDKNTAIKVLKKIIDAV
jgi:hypothetical protein